MLYAYIAITSLTGLVEFQWIWGWGLKNHKNCLQFHFQHPVFWTMIFILVLSFCLSPHYVLSPSIMLPPLFVSQLSIYCFCALKSPFFSLFLLLYFLPTQIPNKMVMRQLTQQHWPMKTVPPLTRFWGMSGAQPSGVTVPPPAANVTHMIGPAFYWVLGNSSAQRMATFEKVGAASGVRKSKRLRDRYDAGRWFLINWALFFRDSAFAAGDNVADLDFCTILANRPRQTGRDGAAWGAV